NLSQSLDWQGFHGFSCRHYLGIDPMGNIAMLGPAIRNVLKSVGNVADYVNDIIAWKAAQPLTLEGTALPLTLARVFHYAENHYPDLFPFISGGVTTRIFPETIAQTCYPPL